MNFLFLSLAIGLAVSLPMEDEAWREYKLKFGKFYEDRNEEAARYAVWKHHLNDVLQHNSNPKNTFAKGLNHFSDLVSKGILYFALLYVLQYSRTSKALWRRVM